MKLSLVALLCVCSFPALATIKTYQNDAGCTLEVNDTPETVVYTLQQGSQKEVVKFSGDYMSVDFTYCPSNDGDIFFTEGSAGYGLMVFCDEKKDATQRGIVDLEIKSSGVVNSFSVTSEVRDENGEWITNKNLSCSGFKAVK